MIHPPKPILNEPIWSDASGRVLLRGVHLELTAALRSALQAKCERLFRHEPRILRLRLDLELEQREAPVFIAKGRIELPGPDLQASVQSDDGYKAIDLLVDRLDRLLRKRSTALVRRRHEDVRAHHARSCPLMHNHHYV